MSNILKFKYSIFYKMNLKYWYLLLNSQNRKSTLQNCGIELRTCVLWFLIKERRFNGQNIIFGARSVQFSLKFSGGCTPGTPPGAPSAALRASSVAFVFRDITARFARLYTPWILRAPTAALRATSVALVCR